MWRATRAKRGFTLVEILLVVIILGILAAVVVPQFANASTEARRTTFKNQLQQLRDQIQIYVLQHGETTPALAGNDWSALITQTTHAGSACGPYLTATPRNPLNGRWEVAVVAADVVPGDAVAVADVGYIYNPDTGHIWGTNTAGTKVFNDEDLQDPNN